MNAEYQLELAWEHYIADRYTPAIQLLKSLLGEDPENAECHGLLAACLLQQKRLHAAEYELRLALNINPRMPFLFLLQSTVLMLRNRHRDAIDACDRALEVDPEYTQALLKKSELFLLLDDNKSAMAAAGEAATITPDSHAVKLAIARCYLSNGDTGQAETLCREVLRQNPQSEGANVLMGNIFLGKNEIGEAEYHAKFAIMNNPQAEDALALFANIKARKNLLLGFWWRINNKLNQMPQIRQVQYLIGAYLFFNLLSQILEDTGFANTASIISYAWLALVVYSWVAMPVYHKMLEKELASFQFNRGF